MSQPVYTYVNALGQPTGGSAIAPTNTAHKIGNVVDNINPFNGDTQYQKYSIGSKVDPNQTGVYWKGQDGNYYVRANTVSGVVNAGSNPNVSYFGGLKAISDPNQNQTGTTYDTAAAGAKQSAADQSALNSYRDEANNNLSTLLNSYNSTVANLKNSYQTRGNQLDSTKAAAQNTYDTNVTNQNQNLLRQDNAIRQGVHNAYQNLMNLLGAYGGGGTSVAQNWAPEAAQHFQNIQMGNANQTTAANLRDLNTGWGNYLNQFEDQKKTLFDKQKQDLANADSTYNDTKAKLNTILGRIGQSGFTPSDIGSQLSGVDVPRVNFVKPTYTGTTPIYNAPNLSTFEPAIPTASFAQPAAVSNSSAAPALAVLLDQQKRQQQNQPAIA